jgi:uncharacterized membrane protein SirB2
MFLGYHSPRQGLYGITLGVTSHVVYSILLQQLSRNRKTRNARYMKYSAYVVAFCVLSVTMNIWYELANKHRVQWIKMLPSTILTTLCVATGFVIANYTNWFIVELFVRQTTWEEQNTGKYNYFAGCAKSNKLLSTAVTLHCKVLFNHWQSKMNTDTALVADKPGTSWQV